MNYQNNKKPNKNDRYVYQLAEEQDGEQILSIIEKTNFKGKMSLLYTRRPDALQSLKSEGDDVDVVVLKDIEEDKIIGFGACSINDMYINGEASRTGYLFALKGLPEYQRKLPVLHRGYKYFESLYKDKDIPFFITTILEENIYTQKMLEKKRRFMPVYEKIGAYNVFSLKPSNKHRQDDKFRKATKEDLPSIVKFLNDTGKRFHFYPVIREADILEGKYRGLNYDNFYILFSDDGQEILAAGSLWKQTEYKQYIVMNYGGVYKLLQPFSFLLKLAGYPPLPKVGEVFEFYIMSFWGVKWDDKSIFRRFIQNISYHAGKDAEMLSIGIPDGNPLKQAVESFPHITYRSLIYSVDWDKKGNKKNLLDSSKPLYLECGLL